MERATPLTILLIDDEASVRRGLRMRLELETDLRIVGEACDGEDGVVQALRLRPDLVLMDLRLPGIDGIEATDELHRSAPEIPVVMLSLQDDVTTRARATAAGAAGYISKHEPTASLLAAIRLATRGTETGS